MKTSWSKESFEQWPKPWPVKLKFVLRDFGHFVACYRHWLLAEAGDETKFLGLWSWSHLKVKQVSPANGPWVLLNDLVCVCIASLYIIVVYAMQYASLPALVYVCVRLCVYFLACSLGFLSPASCSQVAFAAFCGTCFAAWPSSMIRCLGRRIEGWLQI